MNRMPGWASVKNWETKSAGRATGTAAATAGITASALHRDLPQGWERQREQVERRSWKP
ncbi:MAG: hypothetical protein U1F42_03210 [Candidatus Competibacteraceae bacterium]